MEELLKEIQAELERARFKFPGDNVTFAALVEEVGELATALFSESRERVREEAVQVAVMAMRVILDGDHTFDEWRETKALDKLLKDITMLPIKDYNYMDEPAQFVTSESDERVTNNTVRHQYRVLTDDEKQEMLEIKDLGAAFLEKLNSLGNSREINIAKTRVEEAVMWAVKHITG